MYIKEVEKGKQTTLKGWIYNFRSSGSIMFLQLRDGTGFIQCILDKSKVSKEKWEEIQNITQESSIEMTGMITEHPKNKELELHVTDFNIIQIADDYPITKKEHGPDFLLNNRHLWLRSKRQWAIQRIRNTLILSIYEYMKDNGFFKIDSPILTPNACEGTTTLFDLEYFDTRAYLSQSGQLYLEAAIASLGRVFDFGPTFRAEKSKTRRHLTEFWMMDAEAAFVDHKENMKIQEELVCFMVQKVLKENEKELEMLERDTEPLKKVTPPFYCITHEQAIEKLHDLGSDIKQDDDLGADDESILTKQYDKPVFIEKYPAKVKAFYMKREGDKALCSDLLAPEGYGEIIGGSQREDDYNEILKRVKEHKLPIKDFQWYLDLRKYGTVPHSGFGLGLERVVAWVCGLKHVRETIPFPRMINRINP